MQGIKKKATGDSTFSSERPEVNVGEIEACVCVNITR